VAPQPVCWHRSSFALVCALLSCVPCSKSLSEPQQNRTGAESGPKFCAIVFLVTVQSPKISLECADLQGTKSNRECHAKQCRLWPQFVRLKKTNKRYKCEKKKKTKFYRLHTLTLVLGLARFYPIPTDLSLRVLFSLTVLAYELATADASSHALSTLGHNVG